MEVDIGFLLASVLTVVALTILKLYMIGGVCHSDARLDGKVVVITGANTGLGRETARDLVRRGARVILACRNVALGQIAAREIGREYTAADRVAVYHCDLASMESIKDFARTLQKRESRLDILINNAGVMWCPQSQTQDGFEMQIGVNHFGHFLLTNLLLDMLKASAPSRVITLTSIAHYFATIKTGDLNSKLSYAPSDAYAQSKLANVLFTRELARRLQGTGVTTYCVHPGVVRTELGRYMDILQKPLIKFLIFPALQPLIWLLTKNTWQGAQTTIYCAASEQLAQQTGKYYSDCTEQTMGKQALDDELARWLWDTSLQLCGITNHAASRDKNMAENDGDDDLIIPNIVRNPYEAAINTDDARQN